MASVRGSSTRRRMSNEAELARLAEFGKDRADPRGGTERGLTASEINTYMNANFERAKGHRRRIDRKLMKGEWPVLLDIMGKGEGEHRYLSVAEVRTLFDRAAAARTDQCAAERRGRTLQRRASHHRQGERSRRRRAGCVLLVAIAEFPNLIGKIIPPLGESDAAVACRTARRSKRPIGSTRTGRSRTGHWFHHASQGTATFPVPYAWFVALEQPGLHLFTRPGLLADPAYLERFGFIPSPKSVHTDASTLRRFGFVNTPTPRPSRRRRPLRA